MSSYQIGPAALRRLRDLQADLARLPEGKFDMRTWGTCELDQVYGKRKVVAPRCNTTACLGGHLVVNEGAKFVMDYDADSTVDAFTLCQDKHGRIRDIGKYAANLLGATGEDLDAGPVGDLFSPYGRLWEGKDAKSKYDAIRVIDEFIELYS